MCQRQHQHYRQHQSQTAEDLKARPRSAAELKRGSHQSIKEIIYDSLHRFILAELTEIVARRGVTENSPRNLAASCWEKLQDEELWNSPARETEQARDLSRPTRPLRSVSCSTRNQILLAAHRGLSTDRLRL